VLKAQGKNDQAALVEARFRKAWRDADFRRVNETSQN
jgi:hypothetical protein